MLARALLCAAIIAAILCVDWRTLKKAGFKAKLIYGLVLAYSIYTGYGYISRHPLPNLSDIATVLLREPAGLIDKSLKANKSASGLLIGKAEL